MPSLTFVLPHWLYWSGLIALPLLAMRTVRRQQASGATGNVVSLPIAFLLWAWGGFVGLHRFYLKSSWGLVFIPFFLLILYGNVQGRTARLAVSNYRNAILGAEFDVERAQKNLARKREGAAARLREARAKLASTRLRLAEARAGFGFWNAFSGGFALLIALLLAADAFLMPRMVRACAAREGGGDGDTYDPMAHRRRTIEMGSRKVHTAFTRAVDTLNEWVGHFIAYWSIVAVFVYYYEVLARYVFNSPTNWAHEAMFLMFGMQYLLAGGFALKEDSHVRVDVLYLHLSDKAKAFVDILTSVFFFLFTGALLWTGWIFMMDSVNVWEVSFTEWAIQYWPVKSTLAIGALLVLLQGAAKLSKDILFLVDREA